MFGIGFFEILVIGVAVLVFFGPDKLPELAQQFGKFYVQIRRMTSEVKGSFDEAIRKAEHDLILEERAKIQKLLSEQEKTNAVADDSVQKYDPSNQHALTSIEQSWGQSPTTTKPETS